MHFHKKSFLDFIYNVERKTGLINFSRKKTQPVACCSSHWGNCTKEMKSKPNRPTCMTHHTGIRKLKRKKASITNKTEAINTNLFFISSSKIEYKQKNWHSILMISKPTLRIIFHDQILWLWRAKTKLVRRHVNELRYGNATRFLFLPKENQIVTHE